MYNRTVMALVMILMLGTIGCGSQNQTDAAIATVNGAKISQDKLDQQYMMLKFNYESQQGQTLDETQDQAIIQNLKKGAYEEVVMKELVRQEAEKQSIKTTPAQVDTALNNFKQAQNTNNADGYQKLLDKMNLTEADLRQEIATSQLYQQLQEKVVGVTKVTETEALSYYNENPDQFSDPGGIQIYHILVDSEQKATEVMTKIKQGEDFAALAAQYSQDPGSKDKSGDVGPVNASTNFVPEFKQAALTLQPGQLYPVAVKTTYGYHIIKAGAKIAPSQLPFEKVKIQLIQQMETGQKDQAFSAYLEQLKNAADIQDLRQQQGAN